MLTDPPFILSAWYKTGAKLWAVDVQNYFRFDVAELADQLGHKPPLEPGDLAGREEFESWCLARVKLAEDAVLGLAEECRSNDLGCWRPTAHANLAVAGSW